MTAISCNYARNQETAVKARFTYEKRSKITEPVAVVFFTYFFPGYPVSRELQSHFSRFPGIRKWRVFVHLYFPPTPLREREGGQTPFFLQKWPVSSPSVVAMRCHSCRRQFLGIIKRF